MTSLNSTPLITTALHGLIMVYSYRVDIPTENIHLPVSFQSCPEVIRGFLETGFVNLYHQVPSCKQTYLARNLLFQDEIHLQTSDFPASYLRAPQYILLRYPRDQLFDVKITIAHPPHLTAAIGTLIDTDSRPLPLQDLLKLPVIA